MLTSEDVVYDLKVQEGKPVLRLVAIETRKIISHDAASDIDAIPDIFVPVSVSGMAQAVWEASCPPMRAMGAMTDTGIHALEDIDRLAGLKAEAEQEKITESFNKMMAEFAKRAGEALTKSGAFLLPTPPALAAAYAQHLEKERRLKLAVEKHEAAERAAATQSDE